MRVNIYIRKATKPYFDGLKAKLKASGKTLSDVLNPLIVQMAQSVGVKIYAMDNPEGTEALSVPVIDPVGSVSVSVGEPGKLAGRDAKGEVVQHKDMSAWEPDGKGGLKPKAIIIKSQPDKSPDVSSYSARDKAKRDAIQGQAVDADAIEIDGASENGWRFKPKDTP